MPTSSKLQLAHELTRDPKGRGKSGKAFLVALAVVGVIAAVLIMRKSGSSSTNATVAGSGDYYDAAGNLYDANGNLLIAANGAAGGAGDSTSSDEFSQLSEQLDTLEQYLMTQQGGGGSSGNPPPPSKNPNSGGGGTGDPTPAPTPGGGGSTPPPGTPGGTKNPRKPVYTPEPTPAPPKTAGNPVTFKVGTALVTKTGGSGLPSDVRHPGVQL